MTGKSSDLTRGSYIVKPVNRNISGRQWWVKRCGVCQWGGVGHSAPHPLLILALFDWVPTSLGKYFRNLFANIYVYARAWGGERVGNHFAVFKSRPADDRSSQQTEWFTPLASSFPPWLWAVCNVKIWETSSKWMHCDNWWWLSANGMCDRK